MANINWFPEDFKLASSSDNFMNIKEGETRFRILSLPVTGYEEWEGNKPLRYTVDNKPPKPLDKDKPLKPFLSFVVWDYGTEMIRILTVKQATVIKPIQMLATDADWGDPSQYDIKVIKKGEGKETKYIVNPVAPKPLSEEIKQAFRDKPCCLHYLFTGDDPFSCSKQEATKGLFDMEIPADKATIDQKQLDLLLEAIDGDKAYLAKVLAHYRIEGLNKLPIDQFDLVLERATNAKVLRLQKEDSILEA